MMRSPGFEHKTPVAIGTFDGRFVAHFEIDAGMAQGAAVAIAGNAGVVGFDDFGSIDGHGSTQIHATSRIITVKI